ncbi:MAG: Ribonuclease VapC15 [Chloroflexi bacterium ADurb.Bin360]|nr:MAG: Ribonuclease VapC15 [Chloroflexi bacterium ADurb.Bin360]
MWLIDSSVWIDYFNGLATPQTDRLDAALGYESLCLGDIILCEVLQGFQRQPDFEKSRAALLTFPIYPIGSVELAVRSAEHCRFLRQRGITIRKTMDCLIATFAIVNGMALLHSDRDFDPFEEHLGLEVVR